MLLKKLNFGEYFTAIFVFIVIINDRYIILISILVI